MYILYLNNITTGDQSLYENIILWYVDKYVQLINRTSSPVSTMSSSIVTVKSMRLRKETESRMLPLNDTTETRKSNLKKNPNTACQKINYVKRLLACVSRTSCIDRLQICTY